MARVLIVGCGGRGQSLARDLVAEGHAVRGTTREPARAPAIAAAGAEPFVGDPDRIGTLMEAIAGVTVVAWLLGSVQGARAAELHDGRLRMLCEKLVDTPVRGLLYEAAGTQPDAAFERGRAIVADAAQRWSIPVALVEADPADCAAWSEDALGGVRTLLS